MAKKSEVVSFYTGYNGVTIYGFTITLTYHEYTINALFVYFLLNQVPLGLIFQAENTTGGMVEILKFIQEKYVPQVKLDDGTIEVYIYIFKKGLYF